MSEFIKCCPFCGSCEVEVARTNKDACWIECSTCGANVKSCKTRRNAIIRWNERTTCPAKIVDDMDNERWVI